VKASGEGEKAESRLAGAPDPGSREGGLGGVGDAADSERAGGVGGEVVGRDGAVSLTAGVAGAGQGSSGEADPESRGAGAAARQGGSALSTTSETLGVHSGEAKEERGGTDPEKGTGAGGTSSERLDPDPTGSPPGSRGSGAWGKVAQGGSCSGGSGAAVAARLGWNANVAGVPGAERVDPDPTGSPPRSRGAGGLDGVQPGGAPSGG